MKKVNNFYISGTDIKFSKKPSAYEMAEARKSFENMPMADLNEFSAYISAGHPFIMATFKEGVEVKKTAENIERCTGIALDFEGGVKGEWTEDKLMTFCQKYNIIPNIFYHSFSSTTRAPRFRIVYIMNRISPSVFKQLATLVVIAFNAKMGGCKNDKAYGIDSQSILPTQQYNPGKGEVKILNEEYVDFQNFIIAINDLLASKASKVLEKETAINSITDSKESYESCIGTYSYPYEENGRKRFCTNQILGKKTQADNKVDALMYNNTNSDLLLKKCQLTRELVNGAQPYYSYHLSTGLVYSLVKMRNGKEIYKKICENNASSGWKTKERIFDDIKKKDYMPQSCKNFNCPYLNSCPHSCGSPANLAKPAFISRQAAAKMVEVSDARADLDKALESALNGSDDKINIIEAPVGTGKTFAVIDKINEMIVYTHKNEVVMHNIKAIEERRYMTEEEKARNIKFFKAQYDADKNYKFIIASPRHNLCKQIKEDLLKQPNITWKDVCYIVQRPEIPYAPYESEVKQLENLGLLSLEVFKEYLNTFKYLRVVINDNKHDNEDVHINEAIAHIEDEEYLNKIEYSQADYDFVAQFCTEAIEYVKSRENAKDANIVLCTHSFISHCDLDKFNQKIVFIDEDCSESFIATNKMKLQTIDKIIATLDKETYDYYGFEFGFEDIIKSLEFIKSHNDGRIYTYNFNDFLVSPASRPNKKGICKKMMAGVNNKKLEKLIDLKKNLKIDFTKILNLRSFCIEGEWVNYTTFKGLNTSGKKVILTSATPAPEFFYKNIFKKPINRARIDFITLEGSLVQYYDMASYRKNLRQEEYVERIEKIKELEEIECTISYKAFNDKLGSVLNFGNLEGINKYSGKNILVIGTYLVNSTICQLIAHMFDIPEKEAYVVNEIESVKQYKITYNNIEQLFATFENAEAREYQLWQCWKTTEQAIGRARLINNDCKVVLLSKMIHPLATLTTYEEEIEGGDAE